MSKGTFLARRRSSVLHLQVTHPQSQGEISPATTLIFIKPDNRQLGDSLEKLMNKGRRVRDYLVVSKTLQQTSILRGLLGPRRRLKLA